MIYYSCGYKIDKIKLKIKKKIMLNNKLSILQIPIQDYIFIIIYLIFYDNRK